MQKPSAAPFVVLWRRWEEKSRRNGPHHTMYWVEEDPEYERSQRECAIGTKSVAKFRTGKTYAGEWKDNQKNGFGSQIWSNGNKYQGDWKKGKRHGVGTFWIKKNSRLSKRYTGNWKENKKHGSGIFFADDGSKYEGEWAEGKRNGQGKTHYPNGDVYEGDFVNDQRSGFGVLKHPNGSYYEGNWYDDKKEGAGRFYYASTKKMYTGEWADGGAKCGSYEDIPQDHSLSSQENGSRCSKQEFQLPELCLENTNDVLWESFAATRKKRSRELGELEMNRRAEEEAKGEEFQAKSKSGKIHKTVFSKEEVNELNKAFNLVDTESTGEILGSQLVLALNELGIFPLEDDVTQLLEELGANEDSQISLYEFIGLLATLRI